jgi:Gas vesicle protein G
MGLLTGLLTLPLAPVRGTIWIAEQLAAEAERQLDDETSVRRLLAEAERDFELGLLSEEEFEAVEDALLDRLDVVRATDETEEPT